MTETTWSRGYHSNGKLMYETPYVNDKMHGIKKGYNIDGNLSYEIPHVNGKLHGIKKVYHAFGRIGYEIYYIHGNEVTKEELETHELITQLAELDE